MINLAKGMPDVPCIQNSERVVTCTCARNPCTPSEEKTNARDGEGKREREKGRKKKTEWETQRTDWEASVFYVCRIYTRAAIIYTRNGNALSTRSIEIKSNPKNEESK